MQSSYWQNYPSATHYKGWEHEPIPGWGVRPVMAGPRMVGVGSDIPDVAFVCAAQRQLYQTARQLYPGDDAQQFSYILTHGPGFAGNWQAWCAQQPNAGLGPVPATPTSLTLPSVSSLMSSPWVWVGAAVVVGGGLAFAFNKGWL